MDQLEPRALRPHLHGAFGSDRFGVVAERFARAFGTPQFIIGQSALVAVWIVVNAVVVALRWDAYPFILLNLAFSTQAAYAAPLILLAQTRQAQRDKAAAVAFEAHRYALGDRQLVYEQRISDLLEQQATLTRQIDALTQQLVGGDTRRAVSSREPGSSAPH
jgi:uncharacterized membrane protein